MNLHNVTDKRRQTADGRTQQLCSISATVGLYTRSAKNYGRI